MRDAAKRTRRINRMTSEWMDATLDEYEEGIGLTDPVDIFRVALIYQLMRIVCALNDR